MKTPFATDIVPTVYGFVQMSDWLTYRFKQATAEMQRHLFECPHCAATWQDVDATSACLNCGMEPVHSYGPLSDITPARGF